MAVRMRDTGGKMKLEAGGWMSADGCFGRVEDRLLSLYTLASKKDMGMGNGEDEIGICKKREKALDPGMGGPLERKLSTWLADGCLV